MEQFDLEINKDLNSQKESFLNEAKTEINALIWRFASDETTLKNAEILACQIYELIQGTYSD